jgi:hypothetical protein
MQQLSVGCDGGLGTVLAALRTTNTCIRLDLATRQLGNTWGIDLSGEGGTYDR